jgi:hypothetical protein
MSIYIYYIYIWIYAYQLINACCLCLSAHQCLMPLAREDGWSGSHETHFWWSPGGPQKSYESGPGRCGRIPSTLSAILLRTTRLDFTKSPSNVCGRMVLGIDAMTGTRAPWRSGYVLSSCTIFFSSVTNECVLATQHVWLRHSGVLPLRLHTLAVAPSFTRPTMCPFSQQPQFLSSLHGVFELDSFPISSYGSPRRHGVTRSSCTSR